MAKKKATARKSKGTSNWFTDAMTDANAGIVNSAKKKSGSASKKSKNSR